MKLILLFFSGMLTISSFAGATNSPVHDAFLKHLDIFLAADATRSYSSSSISAPEFYAKLDQNNLTPEDYHSFLIACANHSMMSAIRPGKAHTDYITDDEVIDVLVAALACDHHKTRACAINYLISHVGNSARRNYSERIKEMLGKDAFINPAFFLLLAKCDLTDEEKKTILVSPDLRNPVIRTLCGDRAAEKSLIDHFMAATDYKEKRKFTRQLALAGTPACATALAAELDSPVELKSRNYRYSIRFDILIGLGAIHENEPLFIEEVFVMKCCADDDFDQRIGLKQYILDIDQFIRKHYGHPAWPDPDKVWFWTVEVMPIFYE